MPRDGLQDVIEIVRNAAGELAQRDHSFRMSRPRLRSFTCRDLPLDLRLRQKVADEQKSDPVQIDDDDRGVDDHECRQTEIDGGSVLQQDKERAGCDEQNIGHSREGHRRQDKAAGAHHAGGQAPDEKLGQRRCTGKSQNRHGAPESPEQPAVDYRPPDRPGRRLPIRVSVPACPPIAAIVSGQRKNQRGPYPQRKARRTNAPERQQQDHCI